MVEFQFLNNNNEKIDKEEEEEVEAKVVWYMCVRTTLFYNSVRVH